MLLSELDGFLTGILVCPAPIAPAEWMQNVWGTDEGGVPPFDDPLDVQWFADAVMARHDEIARDLRRGKLQPIFDIDERNGDVLWEAWAIGFAEAVALRADAWATLLADPGLDGGAGGDALSRLSLLLAVATDESPLDSVQIDALHDRASADLVDGVLRAQAAVRGKGGGATASVAVRPAKVGRNDPCPCGSGRKSKRCCGGEAGRFG